MKKVNFNQSWKFYKADAEEYKIVDLPHDAMIEEERIPNIIAGDTSGYFPGGRYVYEKEFTLSPEELQGEVIVSFDGVYQKAAIYLNNHRIGGQIQGYTNFQVRLTDYLVEKQNILRVEVDNSQTPNSRWYTGSGIYRDVTLYTGSKAHILPYGIEIKTESIDPVIIEVKVSMKGLKEEKNDKEKVHCKITDRFGKQLQFETLQSEWRQQAYVARMELLNASLWTEEEPILYTFQAELYGDESLDSARQVFGIRQLMWNPKQGMVINGQTVKLRGACIHHDNGILGAREYRDVAYRKIRILKECGYNAIRTAHNEPSEVLLEACDNLGMYVMAEFTDVWRATKNDYDYSLYFDEWAAKDLTQMVKKCIGHPSVIMYSVGNEVYDTRNRESEVTCKMLTETIKAIDDTRPITLGFNVLGALSKPKDKTIKKPKHTADEKVDPKRTGKASPLISSKLMNTISMHLPQMMERVKPEHLEKNQGRMLDQIDFVGLNYGTHLFSLSEINPKRMIVNTETFPSAIGRTWKNTLSHSWVVGDFMWTGWDYLGECGIGVVEYGKTPLRLNKPYPCISGGTGSVNLVGEIEAQGYYTKIVYGLMDQPFIGVHPVTHAGEKVKKSNWRGTDAVNSWAWGQDYGKEVCVEVYSREPMVELLQNGVCVGKKMTNDCKAEFQVIYRPGQLKAISYDTRGCKSGESCLVSDDEVERLSLKAEYRELHAGQVVYVFAEIVDSKGVRKVYQNRDIKFEVEGCGELLATGSGNPWATHPYTKDIANSWNGSAAAVIRAGREQGMINVKAMTNGLDSVEIQLYVNGEGEEL